MNPSRVIDNISTRSIFKVLGIILLFCLGILAVYTTRQILVWIGTAMFVAIALNPLVNWVQKKMWKHNRGLSIGVVFISLLSFIGILLASFVPVLITQSRQLAKSLPGYANELLNGNNWLADQIKSFNLVDQVKQSQEQIVSYLSSAGGSFFSILGGVFTGFAAVATILGLVFFMLLEGPGWIESLWSLLHPKRRTQARNLATQMYHTVTGYVTGNILTSTLAAITTSIVLMIMGVPYAIPLGIVVGLFDVIPLVGATIGAILVTIVALFTSPTAAIIIFIYYMIYQQVENHVLQPLVYGKTVKISPLTVLICILMGAALGGILGALVAIPIGASIQILVKHLIATRQQDHT